jgi:hypothetical protein
MCKRGLFRSIGAFFGVCEPTYWDVTKRPWSRCTESLGLIEIGMSLEDEQLAELLEKCIKSAAAKAKAACGAKRHCSEPECGSCEEE